jgi:hypothetical protein
MNSQEDVSTDNELSYYREKKKTSFLLIMLGIASVVVLIFLVFASMQKATTDRSAL